MGEISLDDFFKFVEKLKNARESSVRGTFRDMPLQESLNLNNQNLYDHLAKRYRGSSVDIKSVWIGVKENGWFHEKVTFKFRFSIWFDNQEDVLNVEVKLSVPEAFHDFSLFL